MNQQKYKIAIVCPVHIQPSKEWVDSLKSVAKDHTVIIVDDSDGKVELPAEWDIYDYARQKSYLGEAMYGRFEIFHGSSACRNFGHFVAYNGDFDIIIGLDSDCIVPPSFISSHISALESNATGWTNPISRSGWFSRGYPYHERNKKVILNMGLWDNELDLYGKDRVDRPGRDTKQPWNNKEINVAQSIMPLSGMNWACWREAIPALLFLPNFEIGDDKIRRHDDIWGGYIFQKIAHLMGHRLTYGSPIVKHDTVVDAQADAKLEEGMICHEQNYYQTIDVVITNVSKWEDYRVSFLAFIESMSEYETVYVDKIKEPLEFWRDLFNQNVKK